MAATCYFPCQDRPVLIAQSLPWDRGGNLGRCRGLNSQFLTWSTLGVSTPTNVTFEEGEKIDIPSTSVEMVLQPPPW